MNNDELKALVRTIPDYPKPGIMFRDVTTLLSHGVGFQKARLADVPRVGPDRDLGLEQTAGLGAPQAARPMFGAGRLKQTVEGGGADFLEPLAVGRIGDLARNATAARRIRNQHAIAPGQR